MHLAMAEATARDGAFIADFCVPARDCAKRRWEILRKGYEKTTAPGGEAYAPGLKRIGIQNWRRASTFAGMSRQSCRASGGVPGLRVAGGSAGRPASSTQWRIGRSRAWSVLSGEKSRDQTRS